MPTGWEGQVTAQTAVGVHRQRRRRRQQPGAHQLHRHGQGCPGATGRPGQAVQGVGPGTSLADTVVTVQSYLSLGDTSDTCSALGALLREVQAQSGKSIPAAEAAQLTAGVERIETVLGC